MIWILLGIALLSGGAVSGVSKDLKADRKHASEIMKGSAQRERALDLLKAMAKTSQQSLDASQKLVKDGLKAGKDHERASADIMPSLEPRVQKIAQLDRQFLDQRDALHKLLSQAQWDSVFQNTPR